jgi:uncharacterized protein
MTHRFADITFSARVRQQQARLGVAERNARLQEMGGPNDRLGEMEANFIRQRDSIYIASVSESGWPYVQHRGGPVGFLKVLDERTIGFADFQGNAQYISVGNLQHDDRVALILVDYLAKQRLKLLGRVRLVEQADDPGRVELLVNRDYRARTERGFVITVDAFDWNCSQHITPRFTQAELDAALEPLQWRIDELEALLTQAGSQSRGDKLQ